MTWKTFIQTLWKLNNHWCWYFWRFQFCQDPYSLGKCLPFSQSLQAHTASLCPALEQIQSKYSKTDRPWLLPSSHRAQYPKTSVSWFLNQKNMDSLFGSKGILDSLGLIWAIQWVSGKPGPHHKSVPQNKYWGGIKEKGRQLFLCYKPFFFSPLC